MHLQIIFLKLWIFKKITFCTFWLTYMPKILTPPSFVIVYMMTYCRCLWCLLILYLGCQLPNELRSPWTYFSFLLFWLFKSIFLHDGYSKIQHRCLFMTCKFLASSKLLIKYAIAAHELPHQKVKFPKSGNGKGHDHHINRWHGPLITLTTFCF